MTFPDWITLVADPRKTPRADVGVTAVISGDVYDRMEMLQSLAEQLWFPDYFGCNWSALEEALLELLPNQGRAVTIVHVDVPAGLSDEDLRVYLEVLGYVASERRSRREPKLMALFPEHARKRLEAAMDAASG